MALIGFSTGALMLGNFREGLRLMRGTSTNAVELSALRLPELPVLIAALPNLDLEQFTYRSVHAPSRFSADEEDGVIELLRQIPRSWPIVAHPDTIHDAAKWAVFGPQLAIENMDRRKSDGRSAGELRRWFDRLPEARMCFDLAHSHQCDRTMTEAFRILREFSDKICQLHISELDSAGHHFPLSYGSIQAFSEISHQIPANSAVILESLNPLHGAEEGSQKAWMEREIERAKSAIGCSEILACIPISSRHFVLSPASSLA